MEIVDDESKWDAFCGLVENPDFDCLNAFNEDQACVEFTLVQYPHLCTLPFEDVSASFQCFFELQGDDELLFRECEADLPPYEPQSSTFDACQYNVMRLTCFSDRLSRQCPDHVEPVLDHFVKLYFYSSPQDLSDCPEFQQALCTKRFQSCVEDHGPLQLLSSFSALLNRSATIPEREAIFNTFCGQVRSLVACLESISSDQLCASLIEGKEEDVSRFVDVYRTFLVDMTCSRPLAELLDVEACLILSSENINSVSTTACAAHEAFDENIITFANSPLDIHGDALCRYITGFLGCLDDTIDLYCHRTQEFSKCYARGGLTWFTAIFLNAECPLFEPNQDGTCNFPADNGASAVFDKLYWVTTAILAVTTFVFGK